MYDVAIIGCGVIGADTAYALSRYDNKVVILEAENDVADCTTKANSAILHAGYDPAPGTRMARLNVRGVALAKEICAKLDVSYKQCGSLVLALDEKELPHLQHLFENGTANGVPNMKILSREETLAMEPNLSEKVCGALWAPSAAIVNPWEYALAMTEVAVRNGVELRRSCKVTNAEAIEGGYRLTVPGGTVEARCVINAAGIWADKVHSMVEPANFHIIPTRGEYYLLDKSEGTRVSHVIFQCPNALGKGVLVAPTVHGNLLVGPNAEPVEGNDTSCTSSGLEFVKTTAQRSVPSINFGESIRSFAGVRANLDVDDFIIGEEPEAPGWIDLAGMKSPGLSAAPAVAVKDTIKIANDGAVVQTPDRAALFAVQTPQCFCRNLYWKALKAVQGEKVHLVTDDCSLFELAGLPVHLTQGDYANLKITTKEDLPAAAQNKGENTMRIGHGYDVHRLVEGRKLIMGGVTIPYEKGLLGHSDADVLLHAVSDALLGAAALGDIGKHFPDTDPRYEGADSLMLLREVGRLLDETGYTVGNIDATVLCQAPKLAPHIPAMRQNIANALGLALDDVSVKATTEEHLGFTGEGLGIAAHAVALIEKK